MPVFIGENGIAKKVNNIFIGENNTAKRVLNGFIGDENGRAMQFFSSQKYGVWVFCGTPSTSPLSNILVAGDGFDESFVATAKTDKNAIATVYKVIAHNGDFYGVGAATDYKGFGFNTKDFKTFNPINLKLATNSSTLYGIEYFKGKFCIVGGNATYCHSNDFENFTLIDSLVPGLKAGSGQYRLVKSINDKLFVGGSVVKDTNPNTSSSYCFLAVSEDGVNFEELFYGIDFNVSMGIPVGIAYGNGAYVVGTTNNALYSYDLKTWRGTDFGDVAVPSVAFGNGVFVVASHSGQLYWSNNGQGWNQGSQITTNSNATGDSLVFDGEKFVFAYPGGIAESQDGKTFTPNSLTDRVSINYYGASYIKMDSDLFDGRTLS